MSAIAESQNTAVEDEATTAPANTPRHRERALATAVGEWELRDAQRDGALGTLAGHFAVFNRFTEIDSMWEGRFMEQIAPGAFTKTFAENRKGMRCLFQHGKDPAIGMKPLGPIRSLDQDDFGASYEVDLMDTAYNRDLKPGLENGLYGASFRFQVIREEVNEEPKRSKDNPDSIPERTITEARVQEFGPVTFGAYADATAGLRSLDDEVIQPEHLDFMRLLTSADPELFEQLLTNLRSRPVVPEARKAEVIPEREAEAAPPAEAPAPPDRSRSARATLKPGAARQLRTSRTMEAPKWKL